MRFLLTGHTGFKGAWMTMLLTELGHSVSGIALDPEASSLFVQASVDELLVDDIRRDIRSRSSMLEAFDRCQPDVLIHLAAQPLVRESYRDPRTTFETNVMGTLNVLEAASQQPELRAQLIVTTDKVYRNVGQAAGYLEADPLGGDDPYSASKAMADILSHSWAKSFRGAATAVARAGNVIGGGDYSRERLVPDLISSLERGMPARLRYPDAIRPWQHVLDCLNGYITIIDRMLEGSAASTQTSAWNIGPEEGSFVTVGDFASRLSTAWGDAPMWQVEPGAHLQEAGILALDATRARNELGWRNLLDLDTAIGWTVEWYQAVAHGRAALPLSVDQIRRFLDLRNRATGL